jgi:Excalibur calcium-binding domain
MSEIGREADPLARPQTDILPTGLNIAGMGYRNQLSTASLLAGSLAIGAVVGVGSLAISPYVPADIVSGARSVAVVAGIKRQREPQAGDYWSGCSEARDAGTAPIYVGEPGYRDDMDGDNDGIACEPYRGR